VQQQRGACGRQPLKGERRPGGWATGGVDRVVQPACEPQVQRTLGGPHNVRQHAAERARENNPRAARELADRKRSAGEVHAEREPPERVPAVVAVRDRVEHQVREDADREPVLERTGFERECPRGEHVRGGDHRTERRGVRVPFPVRRRAPNTSKIEEAIGWRRTRDLDEILADLMTALQDAAAV
jgi:hypothetical protein